ncbi:MAG: poly-gamma-glutamate synthase PgsB [Gemmatimonadota bacterium]|nr:MAG: poly-gamma-glutamate synthase PgsB [Gemmatimonadota bacterium]
MSLILLLALMAIGFACLILERARLDRHREAVPLLIAVTGTRGKSSVTRMLASVLRESGRRVLAKTTGSQAVLILPDGSEREIRRRGRPSIIEQKHVIRLAADLGVDAAVIEMMSIHPENHLVETRHLLKPDIVLVTNLRVDHTAAMGETREAVASVLGLDIPQGARAFVPQQECLPTFRATLEERGGELTEVPPATASPLLGSNSGPRVWKFGENLDLVCAAARSLGIADRTIREGIQRTRGDLGALGIWRYRPAGSQTPCFLVNAFAANDPESTMLVHDRVRAALGADPERCVGLMNLRPDRGDRTLQWVGALEGGFLNRFSRLYVLGLHAPALKRRTKRFDGVVRIEVLRQTRPAEIMQTVLSGIRDVGGIVFGFGNIGGAGEALVMHWGRAGEPWEIESRWDSKSPSSGC